MRRVLSLLALLSLLAPRAGAQAVSEWRTSRGVPVAVVEVFGGDLEHLVAVLPPEASAPETVAGFSAEVTPRPGALLWSVRVPALLVQAAFADLSRALVSTGCASVVALGPVPARELEGSLSPLEDVPARPIPRLPCVLADGGVDARRGSPERVELTLALPDVQDPRFDQIPAFAAWVRARLAPSFAGVRVESALQGGCARLVIRVDAGESGARVVLRRLRAALAALPASSPTADEVTRAVGAGQARSARADVAGGSVARELAERLALGGDIGGALTTPFIDGPTLAALARAILSGHAGFASLVEAERRPLSEAPKTLDNGTVLKVRWIPGEIGVIAVALGGLDPRVGMDVLTAAADAAAREGWAGRVGELAGVPTLALAVPAPQLTDVMERLSDALAAPHAPPAGSLETTVAHALGLAESVTAETVSIALVLPPEVEEGAEAAEKFFSGLASGGVRSGSAALNPGLVWRPGDGPPEEAGVVDLPATPAGLVAAQIVRDRLSRETGVRTWPLAPAGRVTLAVAGEGGTHVPDLEARMAKLWERVRRPSQAGEVGGAARHLLTLYYGDAAEAGARAAAATFLPVVPTDADLLGLDPREVNADLASLPAWEKLVRFANGRAPQVVTPPPHKGGVRKSGPPRT